MTELTEDEIEKASGLIALGIETPLDVFEVDTLVIGVPDTEYDLQIQKVSNVEEDDRG